MKVYALVSYYVQSIIEVFATREAAERFLDEVRQDEPELAEMLGVELSAIATMPGRRRLVGRRRPLRRPETGEKLPRSGKADALDGKLAEHKNSLVLAVS